MKGRILVLGLVVVYLIVIGLFIYTTGKHIIENRLSISIDKILETSTP